MNKVAAYIDGYNLYYSLKEKNWRKYYWLDITCLLQSLLEKEQQLKIVYYFTSPSKTPESHKRQTTYIEALEAHSLIELLRFKVIRGRFEPKDIRCNNCNDFARCSECNEFLTFFNEKETDVNIAVQMLFDAFDDVYDTAFLVTEDSDQVGTIKKIKELYGEEKKVGIVYPPGRNSKELNAVSDFQLHIDQNSLGKYQLPEMVTKPNGFQLIRPDHWT